MVGNGAFWDCVLQVTLEGSDLVCLYEVLAVFNFLFSPGVRPVVELWAFLAVMAETVLRVVDRIFFVDLLADRSEIGELFHPNEIVGESTAPDTVE